MPDFIIRKIPVEVFAAFKSRAKTEGRVMKAILIRLMAKWALDGDEPRPKR
jgi:hypothetical protein